MINLIHPGLLAALALVVTAAGDGNPCKKSAFEARKSCKNEATSDYWLQRAKCTNLPQPLKSQCIQDALDELDEAMQECKEQCKARLELCGDLGGSIYDPAIVPSNFVQLVDNPYLPLIPGTTFVYESEDGLERNDFIVTFQTKDILGISCTVVHDIASEGGEVVEDTFDWFAQDQDGNVWYFGELSMDIEAGELVGLGGSWKAGEDGAKPGIVMEAAPEVGDVYRMEFLMSEAEDAAGVLSLSEIVTVPFGTFTNCLQTEDFTPIEPDALEHKYYAPGIGLVLEVNVEDGARNQLVDIERN